MIVGEQPGDQEDIAGLPFAGPSGALLDEALQRAGLVRDEIYITNAVKHFSWTPGEKVRIHKRPTGAEMHACRPWLDAEILKVKPQVILALGTTAGTAIFGKLPKISEERGRVRSDLKIAPHTAVSWHPSAILRASSEQEKARKFSELVEDLKLAYLALKL